MKMFRGKTGFLASLVLAICSLQTAYGQSVFLKYGPVAGIQKSTGSTYQNTAAASADVIGLWSGCSGSNFLRGDGTCTVPAGTGVSSVSVPAPLTATTCSGGACVLSWTTGQTANRILATPDGTTGAVSLRAMVAGDVPPINLGSTANGGVSSATILLGTNGGTSNGFFSVTGPITALRTFTFPNASATVLTSNAAVTVAQGGTGLATLPVHGVLLGEGTSNVGNVAAMAADTLLQGQGTGVDPAAVSVNNCGSGTQALSYSTSTHTFGCQTISVGGTGTVTNVATGTGLTGGPITTTGTLSVDQTASLTWTGTELFRGGLSRGGTTSQITAGLTSTTPLIGLTNSAATTDQKSIELDVNSSGDAVLQTVNEAANATRDIFRAARGTGIAIASITLGNSTDNPTLFLNGKAMQVQMTGALSTNGSNCTMALNVGLSACTRTGTGVYTFTTTVAANNCVATTTISSGTAAIATGYITLSGTTATLNTFNSTGVTNTAADLTFGAVHIICE